MLDSLELIADQLDYLISGPLAIICELAHYTVAISGVKKSWGQNFRTQPFATWIASLCCCFGGGTLVNLFCGKPALASLLNTQSLIMASMLWWLIFYSPKNFFSQIAQWQPIAVILLLLKEMIRTRKIMKGVAIARAVYPSSLLLCTLIGMLSACGGGFIKTSALTLSKNWNKDSIKEVYFSFLTKCCLIFSLLYNLQIDSVIPISTKAVALIQISLLYAVSLSSYFGQPMDIFAPIEQVATSLFISYSAFAAEAKPEPAPVKAKSKSKSNKKEE